MECNKTIARIIQLLIIIVQISQFSETSHVQSAKKHIKSELSDTLHSQSHEIAALNHEIHNFEREFQTKISGRSRRWSHRKRLGTTFSPWTAWTKCDYACKQRRERYCTVRKKCGETRHVEERRCPDHICTPIHPSTSGHHPFKLRSSFEDDENSFDDRDYIILKRRPKNRPKKKKIVVEVDDYSDDDDDTHETITNFNNNDDRSFANYKKRIQNKGRAAQAQILRHTGRKRRRKTIEKKNLNWNWDRNMRNDDYGDEDDTKYSDTDTDTDIDEIDEDTAAGGVDDDTKTELKRKNVRGSDIASKNYLNSDNMSQKLDRNYGLIFDTTTISPIYQDRSSGSFLEPGYDWFSMPRSHLHNEDFSLAAVNTNRRWDTFSLPTVRPVPSPRRTFGSSDILDDIYNNRQSDPYNGSTGNSHSIGAPSMSSYPARTESKNYGKEKAVFDMPSRFRRIYGKWTKWSKCSAKCTTRRFKRCKAKDICGNEIIREVAYCYTEGSFCQTWIDGQVKKNTVENRANNYQATTAVRPYTSHKEPIAANRRESNAISNDYYSYYGKTTKPPEPSPQTFSCGFPMVRNKPKHYLWGMLRIIGGKTARKGQWPWQVAILNRFKEAFCGGTLVSPLWVLTAAHCVRKKLYVRLGEHNLDVDDGTEIQFRIEYTVKHPKYDKRTVDNDVAMLRLPKDVQPSMFVGFACLPQSGQLLPKNHQCTIIGWGKRRNTDEAGTSILHEAEVPIISNEDCKNVYFDYTITKNMFCAGHRRGRIDTCAGDSGGPLLCRDTTVPNQPWTIFGITSFGDGCGKRNKFGIYAKLPNYVDWIWSVINCNGVCNY